jgi:hypothetical protein
VMFVLFITAVTRVRFVLTVTALMTLHSDVHFSNDGPDDYWNVLAFLMDLMLMVAIMFVVSMSALTIMTSMVPIIVKSVMSVVSKMIL